MDDYRDVKITINGTMHSMWVKGEKYNERLQRRKKNN